MLKIPLHGKTYDPSANQYPVSTFRLSEVARVYAIGRVEGERRGAICFSSTRRELLSGRFFALRWLFLFSLLDIVGSSNRLRYQRLQLY